MVINPLLIANFAKRSLRKTKTNKKDAKTIAKFLLENRGEISQLSISPDLQDLRILPEKGSRFLGNGGRIQVYKLLALLTSYDLWSVVRLWPPPYLLLVVKFLISAPIESG